MRISKERIYEIVGGPQTELYRFALELHGARGREESLRTVVAHVRAKARAIAKQRDDAVEALRKHQWCLCSECGPRTKPACVSCGMTREEGHAPDCALDKIIKGKP